MRNGEKAMRTYVIMNREREVAQISQDGKAAILWPDFMPYNLYLEEEEDISTRIENLNNFNYWCASRVLALDRKYAKEILNAIGASQGRTDRDRAKVALSYHALTLTDVFWVKEIGEAVTFDRINLYAHPLSDAFVPVSLLGKMLTAENSRLLTPWDTAGDVSVQGSVPKAFIKREGSFFLLKDGDKRDVKAELLASKISRCFDVDQVLYEPYEYDGHMVSASRLFTSVKSSLVPMEYADIYAINHDTTRQHLVEKLDSYGYHMMNVIDYLIGNTDRHWGNWGFLIDNDTNRPLKLHPLMDFNKAFLSYDDLEGSRCLTAETILSQREAAVIGVKAVGLNQKREVFREWFHQESDWEMFRRRLEILAGQI